MKDMIILEKVRDEEEILLGSITNTNVLAKVSWVYSTFDLTSRNKSAMSDANLNAVKKQELTGGNQYRKRFSKVEKELN